MNKILLAMTLLFSIHAENLKEITLSGDKGARVTGEAWSSAELKDKVYVLFYVDPDEKDLNNHVSDALKKEKFDLSKYGSVAIINMAATWKPNFAIQSALEDKQKEFPDTIYVRDMDKHVLKAWGLKDDSSNVLLFDKSGKNIYKILGKATDAQVAELIKLTKENL